MKLIVDLCSIITSLALAVFAWWTYYLNKKTIEIEKISLDLQAQSLGLQQKEDNRSERIYNEDAQKDSDSKFKDLLDDLKKAHEKYKKDKESLKELKKQPQHIKYKQKGTTWENYKPSKKIFDLTGANNSLKRSKKNLLEKLNNFGKSFCNDEINKTTLSKYWDTLPAELCFLDEIAEIYVESIRNIEKMEERAFQNLCVVWKWEANSFTLALNKKFNTKDKVLWCKNKVSIWNKVFSLFLDILNKNK